MKSGLEGRNNNDNLAVTEDNFGVSMKSGLEGRNNALTAPVRAFRWSRLNEVRPRRPEQ